MEESPARRMFVLEGPARRMLVLTIEGLEWSSRGEGKGGVSRYPS